MRNGWPIGALDISVAFLKGVTYQELAQLTGEPMREVNFYLPASNTPTLRKVPGFEDFDPQREVLHCDKPGTGTIDAPKAFSLQLRLVTTRRCKLVCSSVDGELCFRHESGQLVCIVTKHVDDLKIAGMPSVVQEVLMELQKVFRELKVTWNTFLNRCSTRKTRRRLR